MESRRSALPRTRPLARLLAWTEPLSPTARFVLLPALLAAALALDSARAPAGSLIVVGSGVTTKAGQPARLTFTVLNRGTAPTHLGHAVSALPPGISVTAGSPGSLTVEPGTAASITLDLAVSFGVPVGPREITLQWSDSVTQESGVAPASLLLTPYDSYSPTLEAAPDPLQLIGAVAGNVRGLAGCLTGNNGTPVPWFITECPFVYHTRVENPVADDLGLVSVTPLTGPLDIPEGSPTPINQVVTAPADGATFGLNLVTVEIDVLTPAGWRRSAASCRYAVVWHRPSIQLLAVAPRHWGELKVQFQNPR